MNKSINAFALAGALIFISSTGLAENSNPCENLKGTTWTGTIPDGSKENVSHKVTAQITTVSSTQSSYDFNLAGTLTYDGQAYPLDSLFSGCHLDAGNKLTSVQFGTDLTPPGNFSASSPSSFTPDQVAPTAMEVYSTAQATKGTLNKE